MLEPKDQEQAWEPAEIADGCRWVFTPRQWAVVSGECQVVVADLCELDRAVR